MEPSLGSILRMVETPPVGGDTLFANMEVAYENLPDEIKEKLEGAYAVHDFALFRNRLIKQGKSPEEIEEFIRDDIIQKEFDDKEKERKPEMEVELSKLANIML